MNTSDAYLVGYYGMQNSGDDALLAATLWGAKHFLNTKTVKASTPIPLTMKDTTTFEASVKRKQRFRGQNRLLNYKEAFRAERIIFGGGSVLHTAQDINIKRHMMSLSQSNKNIAVGVSIGPFKNLDAEIACSKFLNQCDYVAVRDTNSYQLGRHIAPQANVKISFDLAPLLLKHDHFKLKDVDRKGIAVCLCPKERFSHQPEKEQQRLIEISKALIAVYKQTGEPVHLININGHSELGDNQVHQELKRLLANQVPCTVVPYDPNPFRVLQRLACYKAITSMRLHGSILGFLAQTPVLSLNYHEKCVGWCDQIGIPEALAFNLSAMHHEPLSSSLLHGLEHGFKQPKLTVSESIKRALTNWK